MDLYKPIETNKPKRDWKNIKIKDNGEKLMRVQNSNKIFVDFKYCKIFVDSKHYEKMIKGSKENVLIRETVYKKLLEASKLLPDGYGFLIWDGWHSKELQNNLYNIQFQKILNEKTNLTRIEMEIKIKEKATPCFLTGGALALSLLKNNCEVDMGTGFGDSTPKSQSDWFERELKDGKLIEQEKETLKRRRLEVLKNRRLLYNVMVEAGFTNCHKEWCHFDYGNQFWASCFENKNAIYGNI